MFSALHPVDPGETMIYGRCHLTDSFFPLNADSIFLKIVTVTSPLNFSYHAISRTIYAAKISNQPTHSRASQLKRFLKFATNEIGEAKM